MERWPSGQWQQTVNLPSQEFEGSNPSLSTIKPKTKLSHNFYNQFSTP